MRGRVVPHIADAHAGYGSHLGAIRPASPTARIGACRINLISQAVPTVHPRVGLGPHCRAGIRPSPIWGGQTKWEIAESMTELRYLAPDTLDEAIGAFAKAGSAARILAGGTDLLVQMRSGVLKPGVIVDIKKIPEMTAIEQTADGGFRIGAAVSGMALAEHKNFGKVWPGVLEAVNLIGSKQVQGRASAGGNLCNGSPAGDSVPAMV